MEETRMIDGNAVVFNTDPVLWYDEHENPLGEGMIDEAVARGHFVRSAHVWLVTSSGKLYVQQRSLQVLNNPGKWSESGGGYVDKGATSLETAVHEIREELGMTISPEQFEKIATITQFEKRHDGSESKQFVDVYLVLHDFAESDVRFFARDVKGGKFVDWRNFAEMLEKKEIDFVDHPEEIAAVMAELAKRFGEK